jgi:phage baseplate assembly protein W
MTTFYRGFSTVNRAKKFRATDIDLVKQDLINHFNIRKGEKLMQPNFGSVIWSVLFEPLDSGLQDIITQDVETIVGYDPRISLTQITVTGQEYGLQLELELVYLPTNQATSLSLQFDANSLTLTSGGPY